MRRATLVLGSVVVLVFLAGGGSVSAAEHPEGVDEVRISVGAAEFDRVLVYYGNEPATLSADEAEREAAGFVEDSGLPVYGIGHSIGDCPDGSGSGCFVAEVKTSMSEVEGPFSRRITEDSLDSVFGDEDELRLLAGRDIEVVGDVVAVKHDGDTKSYRLSDTVSGVEYRIPGSSLAVSFGGLFLLVLLSVAAVRTYDRYAKNELREVPVLDILMGVGFVATGSIFALRTEFLSVYFMAVGSVYRTAEVGFFLLAPGLLLPSILMLVSVRVDRRARAMDGRTFRWFLPRRAAFVLFDLVPVLVWLLLYSFVPDISSVVRAAVLSVSVPAILAAYYPLREELMYVLADRRAPTGAEMEKIGETLEKNLVPAEEVRVTAFDDMWFVDSTRGTRLFVPENLLVEGTPEEFEAGVSMIEFHLESGMLFRFKSITALYFAVCAFSVGYLGNIYALALGGILLGLYMGGLKQALWERVVLLGSVEHTSSACDEEATAGFLVSVVMDEDEAERVIKKAKTEENESK